MTKSRNKLSSLIDYNLETREGEYITITCTFLYNCLLPFPSLPSVCYATGDGTGKALVLDSTT